MNKPRIFIINDPVIAEELDGKIDEPFEHIDRHSDWLNVCERGEIFIVNTSGKNASVGLNPLMCIDEYHDLVLEVLTKNEPPTSLAADEVWQPATWLDCDTESPHLSRKERLTRSKLRKIKGCIDIARHTKHKHVSRTINGFDALPKAVEITKRFRERVEAHARENGEEIAYSTLLDHYLKHGDLKKITRKPKS
ncbi:hypothetical protein KKF55_00815 [Patescibacteria group bacterium]|nr:hypothetical protein [Patescibacteria group bacterium]